MIDKSAIKLEARNALFFVGNVFGLTALNPGFTPLPQTPNWLWKWNLQLWAEAEMVSAGG